MAPSSLGRYRITRELGRGAMGHVYLAHDPEIDRPVAVKTIEAFAALPAGRREGARRQFMAEARAAGKLLHPAIVTLFDAGESDGTLFLAMEYVEGDTLDRFTAPNALLPVEDVVDLIAAVAEALDYAHRAGVIHRDIKPANLMRLGDGSVKIMDFGLAGPVEAQLSDDGSLLGTPAYMSPERVRDQPVDGRSDLFSLAVVLYELLTGRRPFAGGSVSSVIYRIVNEPPVAIDEDDPRVTDGLRRFLDAALAKRPEDRLVDGAAFAAALRAAAGLVVVPGAESAARQPSEPAFASGSSEPPGTPPARGRAGRARSGARGGSDSRRTSSRGPRGRRERRRATRLPLVIGAIALLAAVALAWTYRDRLLDAGSGTDDAVPVATPAAPDGPSVDPTPEPGRPTITPTVTPPVTPTVRRPTAAPPVPKARWVEASVRTEPPGAQLLLDGVPLDDGTDTVRFPAKGPFGTLTAVRACRKAERVLQPADAGGEVVLVLDDPVLTHRLAPGVEGAEVRLNDTVVGRTPLELSLDLCRENRIDLSKDGFLPAQAQVPAGALPVAARTRLDSLTLEEIPKALVRLPRFPQVNLIWYLDGERLGANVREVEVPEGRHELRIKNEYHYIDETSTIDVVGGITYDAPVEVPELTELVVQAYPPNCKVYLRRPGGRWRHVDDTPFRRKVAVGAFEVRIQLNPTGESQERKIRLVPGENPPIRVSFGARS